MIAPRRSNRGFSIIELLVVLAVGAVVMAIGTPVLRGALGEQRLVAGATELSGAMMEARRLAIRANQATRVEVNPADGRISVFAVNTNTNAEMEARRAYLPPGVGFETLMIITNYGFDSLGRPASLPMSIGVQAESSGAVRTVTVHGSGRVEVE